MAPVLGLHTRVVHLVLTERNPFSMALQISSRLPSSDENAMTDGPAPLMVNPFAPAAMTAFFIRSKPGIENFLAGSTIAHRLHRQCHGKRIPFSQNQMHYSCMQT